MVIVQVVGWNEFDDDKDDESNEDKLKLRMPFHNLVDEGLQVKLYEEWNCEKY